MVKLLFFAQLQEEIGTDELLLAIEETTVRQLKEQLKETYKLPQLDQVMVAINEVFARNEDSIKDGDTVAMIPPISGG